MYLPTKAYINTWPDARLAGALYVQVISFFKTMPFEK